MRIFLILILVSQFWSCNKENKVEDSLYDLNIPPHFEAQLPPLDVPKTKEVALGKKLFFDPLLSGNNRVSCASCHHNHLAFSDGLALSNIGVNGKTIERHAPALFNLAWMPLLFWDGGATNLQRQVFGPLEAENEMFQKLDELINELQAHSEYQSLFSEVYPEGISTYNMSRAIAAYETTLISAAALYDKFIAGNEQVYSENQLAGYQIFKSKCSSCHKEPLFTDNAFHNNGLDDLSIAPGHLNVHLGRYRISNKVEDQLKYKTPSLRNLRYTAPYMHDGRFSTLKEVFNHYNQGVKNSITLDSLLQKEENPGIRLSEKEQELLLIFLNTLNDSNFVKNKNHIP